LQDEAQPAGSVQTRQHIIHKSMRQDVQFPLLKKLDDCEGSRGKQNHDDDRREDRAFGKRKLHLTAIDFDPDPGNPRISPIFTDGF